MGRDSTAFIVILSTVSFTLCACRPIHARQVCSSQSEINAVEVRSYRFSKIDKDAQMWSGMYIASNNKIYIGLCTHGDAANVYEFDPETETMRHLANLTILAEERGKGIWTTGKIHAQMQELDGHVYFGSFCEDNGPPAIDASSYNGPHWYRIHMKTGKVERLSLISSFWGLLGQAMDKQRRVIYGLAEDGHLYKYYIDEDFTEDLGRVDNWDICRTIFADDKGCIYGSYPPGKIWKYDPEPDRIFDFQFIRLPIINVSRTMANPMLDRKAQWRIIEWNPTDKVAYGIVGGSNMLFKYDVHNGPEGTITSLTQMCAPPFREGGPFKIPHATLAMTISHKERKVYYIPVLSGDFDYGAVELNVYLKEKMKKATTFERLPSLSYMISYDLKTGQREDIGLLRTPDGRYAYGLGGAETDKHGRIWVVGAFEETDEEYVVRRINGIYPYSMQLACYDPMKQTR